MIIQTDIKSPQGRRYRGIFDEMLQASHNICFVTYAVSGLVEFSAVHYYSLQQCLI